MKISYNRDEDIMILEVSEDKIDFAEEMGPIIVHFNEKRKPVLLEILEASEFIATTAKSSIILKDKEQIEISI